ncbi:MAG: hypothetical protein ACRD0B_11115, partial [Acidimicrobiales bacterium]
MTGPSECAQGGAIRPEWAKRSGDMLTDPSAFAADREARNEYLIEIDEAWELCRDAVEGARTNYETELDSSRGVFEWERAQASSV